MKRCVVFFALLIAALVIAVVTDDRHRPDSLQEVTVQDIPSGNLLTENTRDEAGSRDINH